MNANSTVRKTRGSPSAAEVFDQRDEDGIVTLLNADPPPELHEAVRHAAALCPALAITVREQP